MVEQDSDDFSIDVAPRLLINDTRLVSDATPIKFIDGDGNSIILKNDKISVPYFYKEGTPDHLCYADMFDGNTNSFIECFILYIVKHLSLKALVF